MSGPLNERLFWCKSPGGLGAGATKSSEQWHQCARARKYDKGHEASEERGPDQHIDECRRGNRSCDRGEKFDVSAPYDPDCMQNESGCEHGNDDGESDQRTSPSIGEERHPQSDEERRKREPVRDGSPPQIDIGRCGGERDDDQVPNRVVQTLIPG